MLLGYLSEKSCDIGLCWAEFSASALFSLVLIFHDVWDVELLGCCGSLERLMEMGKGLGFGKTDDCHLVLLFLNFLFRTLLIVK